MEADFSIRNEVESVRPSNEQDEYSNYAPPESPFDEFITGHMDLPPAPPTTRSTDSNYWAKQAYLNSRMIHEQQRLIHNQQVFNRNLLGNFFNFRNLEKWKWIALCSIAIAAYLVWCKKTERPSRFNPKKSRRSSRRAHNSPYEDEFSNEPI